MFYARGLLYEDNKMITPIYAIYSSIRQLLTCPINYTVQQIWALENKQSSN